MSPICYRPRPGSGILVFALAWVLLLGTIIQGFTQTAPKLTGTLPDRSVLAGGSDQLNLSAIFHNQAPGTAVQLTVVTTGTSLASGTNTINLALSDTATPITVANFLSYVGTGAYNNSFFHRSFDTTGSSSIEIVQGGGFYITDGTSDLTASTLAAVPSHGDIVNEYKSDDSNPNSAYTIAMARTSNANSASSQWFINVADNSTQLGYSNGGGYAVFGKIIGSGTAVANAIFGLQVSDLAGMIDNNLDSAFTEIPLSGTLSGTSSGMTVPRSDLVMVQSACVIPSLTFSVVSSDTTVVTTSTNVVTGSTSSTTYLSLNYGNPGTATITVTATDLAGTQTSGSFNVVVSQTTSSLVEFQSRRVKVSGTSTMANLYVSCTGGATSPFTINYSTADGTAISGSDYTGNTSGTLNFSGSPGETGTISIPILTGTAVPLPGKTFTVGLSSTGGEILGTATSARVTILETSAAGILQFSSPTYSADQYGNLQVQVTRTSGSSGEVSVGILTLDGTGTNGAASGYDFDGTAPLITFADRDTATKTAYVPLGGSAKNSAWFTVKLQAPTNGATLGLISTATATAYFTNYVEFEQPSYTVNPTYGKATITVVRTGTAETVTVPYAITDGTNYIAGSTRHYPLTSGTLTFGKGVTSQDIKIPVTNPGLEPQSFLVTLSSPSPSSYTLTTGSQATVTIVKASSAGSVQFQDTSYTFDGNLSAQDTGNAHYVNIIRSGNTTGSNAVYVQLIDGSAKLGTDYFASVSNWSGPVTRVIPVSFQAGQTSGSIALIGYDANPSSLSENFSMRLLGSNDGKIGVGKKDSASVTFLNQDFQGGIIEFSRTGYTFDETSGAATLTVVRTGTGAVSFTCETVNGSAKANVDYKPITTTGTSFSFPEGSGTAVIPITLLGNKSATPASRSFKVKLKSITAGEGSFGTENLTTTVTIIAAKNPKGVFEFEQPSYSFSEDSGWAELEVVRNSGTAGAVDVYFETVDNFYDWTRGNLYGWPSPSNSNGNQILPVHFEPGQTRQKVLIPLIAGGASYTYATHSGTSYGVVSSSSTQGIYPFYAELYSTTGGIIGAQNLAEIDDYAVTNLPPSVQFGSTQYRVNALASDTTSVVLPAYLYCSSSNTGTITVPFQVNDGTALLGRDYELTGTAVSGTLTFSGTTEVDLPIKILANSANSLWSEKRFSVQLQAPTSTSGTLLAQTTATVTILPPNATNGLFQVENPTYSFDEDCGAFSVNIIRSGTGQLAKPASIIVTTNDGSAAGDLFEVYNGSVYNIGFQNYGWNTETLTFATGETQKSFPVLVRDNALLSGTPANFIVRIESADGGAEIGAQDTAVVTLYNPHLPSTSVDFAQPSYEVDSLSGTFNATVRRLDLTGTATTTGSTDQLTVDYTITSPNVTVSPTTGTVTLAPGTATAQIAGSFTSNTTGQLTIQLSNPQDVTTSSNSVAILGNKVATVTIQPPVNQTSVFAFDAPGYSIAFSSSSYEIPVRIVRSGNTNRAASVRLKTVAGYDGMGEPNYEYLPLNQVVNFAANEVEQQVLVEVGGAYPPYFFAVQLVSTGKNSVLGAQDYAFVDIEPAQSGTGDSVGFVSSSYNVDTTDTNATAIVTLYATGTDPVQVPYWTGTTPSSGPSFSSTSGTIVLSATVSGTSTVTGTISVPLTSGTADSLSQIFLWHLGDPVAQSGTTPVVLTGNRCVPETINGLNNSHGVLRFQSDTYNAPQNSSTNVTVQRLGGTSGQVMAAALITSSGTGAAVLNTDYTVSQTQTVSQMYQYESLGYYVVLTFAPKENAVSIPFKIKASAIPNRVINLELVPVTTSGGAVLDSVHTNTTITITKGND